MCTLCMHVCGRLYNSTPIERLSVYAIGSVGIHPILTIIITCESVTPVHHNVVKPCEEKEGGGCIVRYGGIPVVVLVVEVTLVLVELLIVKVLVLVLIGMVVLVGYGVIIFDLVVMVMLMVIVLIVMLLLVLVLVDEVVVIVVIVLVVVSDVT